MTGTTVTAAPQHHAVVVPLPGQGHMNPLMRLCKLLAWRHGFLITFVNNDAIHERLLQLQQQKQQRESVPDSHGSPDQHGRIHMAGVALPALDLNNDFRVSIEHFMEVQQGISDGLERLIHSLKPPATCIISDLCMTSPTQLVADRLGIPHVMFFPCSQSYHMLKHHLLSGRLSIDQAITTAQTCKPETFGDPAHEGSLEGLVSLVKRDLPHYKHVHDDTEYLYRFLTRELKVAYERSHAIVVNSFSAIEGDAIEAFAKLASKPRLYAVGPCIEELTNESNTSLWEEDPGCIEWLDKQPANSVLYVSFGSVALLSKEQFEELLLGIESSNQRFLWAFRPDLVEGGMSAIPLDFLERISGRGYFTPWAPQVSVLKHCAVGAFLTHCGWNSTMEGITSGVPMLCWPYFGDQFMNAKYISEVWKVGLTFQYPLNLQRRVVAKGEIERVIRMCTQGEEGKILRENATRYKEAARRCQEIGGQQQILVDSFVESLA